MAERISINLDGLTELLWIALVIGAVVWWSISDTRAECRQKLYKATAADSLRVIKADKYCTP